MRREGRRSPARVRAFLGGWVVAAVAVVVAGGGGPTARAASAEFQAQLDPAEIGLQETTTLRLTLRTDNAGGVREPTFNAPDLEIVNQFPEISTEAEFDASTFTARVRATRIFNYVLRPLRAGKLTVRRIRAEVDGQTLAAADLSVTVTEHAPSRRAPVRRGFAGPGDEEYDEGEDPAPGRARPGAPKRGASEEAPFIRAESSQTRPFKGEQVLVAYYLYVPAGNPVAGHYAERHPVQEGFLREDLEVPMIQPRLTPEDVTVRGRPWTRYLLARYALYPLKEGKLKVDALNLKFNVLGRARSIFGGLLDQDGDSPFGGFPMARVAREAAAHSDPLPIEVRPLPTAGRPADFSGGVGDFTVTAQAVQTEVRAGEPFRFTVRVEGRGNLSAVAPPAIEWPPGLAAYDLQSRTRSLGGGVSQKTFEISGVGRTPGDFVVPGVSFAFFDPRGIQYIRRSAPPVAVRVLPGAAGATSAGGDGAGTASEASKPAASATPPSPPAAATREPAPIVGPKAFAEERFRVPQVAGTPAWRWVFWSCLALLGILVVWVLADAARRFFGARARRARAGKRGEEGKPTLAEARERLAGAADESFWAALEGALLARWEECLGVPARARGREELRDAVADRAPELLGAFDETTAILEAGEGARFSGAAASAGARATAADALARAERVWEALASG